jgi:hypothetical protein
MKKLFFTLFFANVISLSFAQHNLNAHISNLQTFFKNENREETIKWLPKQQAVQIGNYVYPIAETTHVKIGDNDKVEFFMQKGTAITDIRDTKWRRAYWAITFSNRQSCKEFVKLIESFKIDIERNG